MAWTPSLWGSSQEEPGVIERDVFDYLDTNQDGFVTLKDMQPLLGNSDCHRVVQQALKAHLRRCRKPEMGFSPREFAAAFREDAANRVVLEFYQGKFEEEFASEAPTGKQGGHGQAVLSYLQKRREGAPAGETPCRKKVSSTPQQTRTTQKARTPRFTPSPTGGIAVPAKTAEASVEEDTNWRPEDFPSLDLGATGMGRASPRCLGATGSRSAGFTSTVWTECGIKKEDLPSRVPSSSKAAVPAAVEKPVTQFADPQPDSAPQVQPRQRRRTAPAGVAWTEDGKSGKNVARAFRDRKGEPARRWRAKEPTVVEEVKEETAIKLSRCLSVHFDSEVTITSVSECPSRAEVQQHGVSCASLPCRSENTKAIKETVPDGLFAACLGLTCKTHKESTEAATASPDVPHQGVLLMSPTGAEKAGEIDSRKQELSNALAEIERLKRELADARENSARLSISSVSRRRHSINPACRLDTEDAEEAQSCHGQVPCTASDDEQVEPLPPDGSSSWDWPLSRHEKKARIHLLERKMHAMDRKTMMEELRRGAICEDSASDSEDCAQ
jgi:hypothetical protein